MKRFYQYAWGMVNEMASPTTVYHNDGWFCFLIYAKDEAEARKLAYSRRYNNRPLTTLYGITFNGEYYDKIENVIA